MSDTVIVAIFSLMGTFGGILASNRLTIYRIGQLEEKVNKHNNLIDRMYKVEEKADLQEEKIKVANHRICDLEEK
ncbi:MAG: hypothetical protein RRX92_08470 [Lachnospiraceae bacterium]